MHVEAAEEGATSNLSAKENEPTAAGQSEEILCAWSAHCLLSSALSSYNFQQMTRGSSECLISLPLSYQLFETSTCK